MRHRVFVVALVAAVIAFGVSGCADQTAEANKAIDAANVQIGKYTQAGTQLEGLMSQAETLAMEPTSAKRGIELTDRMKAKLEEQRVAAEAARTDIGRIRTMKVRAEFRTYADKEIAVTESLLQQTPVAAALVDEMRKVYELVASGKGTQSEIAAIGERIDADAAKLAALETEAAKREKAASDYFTQQKLGGG